MYQSESTLFCTLPVGACTVLYQDRIPIYKDPDNMYGRASNIILVVYLVYLLAFSNPIIEYYIICVPKIDRIIYNRTCASTHLSDHTFGEGIPGGDT